MRVLERNKQTFYYSLYEGKVPILDHNGYETGEYKIKYSQPIKTSGVISPSKGKSQVDLFGRDVEYDRVIMLDDITCPIDESSIIFINYELSKSVDSPEPILFDSDNNPLNDYVVKAIGKSLNSISIAISRVKKS